MSQIGLIDYGMGNLHSVQRGFERLGTAVRAVHTAADMVDCDALVLPGVGAFDPAMERLTATGLDRALQESCRAGRPLLGICLGLQLLFEGSEEGVATGLSLLPGRVRALPPREGHPIPHMGWAPLLPATPSPLLPRGTRIKVGTTGSLERILRGPANLDDGTQNLLGCIRTSMGTLGARTIKEMQQVEVVVAPSLLTEGKVYQKAQQLGMGK